MDKYYKPSGRFSPISIVFLIIICSIAIPILGFLYSYAIWYIPFIYINFIITGLLGYATALLISRTVIRPGKVRNNLMGLLFGFIGGLAALYFHWVVWVDLAVNAGTTYGNSRIGITISNINIDEVLALAVKPATLLEYIQDINAIGTWSIKTFTVSGTFLTVIWIIEALMITGIPLFMSYLAAKKPFCEIGNVWFKEKILPPFPVINEKEKIITDLENGYTHFFGDLSKADNLKDSHSIFTLYYSDNGEYYLTIVNKIAKLAEKGKIDFKEDIIIEYISINRAPAEILLAK